MPAALKGEAQAISMKILLRQALREWAFPVNLGDALKLGN